MSGGLGDGAALGAELADVARLAGAGRWGEALLSALVVALLLALNAGAVALAVRLGDRP